MEENIDILLATYNGEKYIKEQIESILNQTYKNINLIISDDCSTDNTRKILTEYTQKDKRITVYFQNENQGYIKNFEFLLKQVKNPYYMLSDQDDVWLPEKVEKSIKTLKEKNVDFVFGDLEVVDQNLNTIYSSFGDFMLLNRKIKRCINSYKLNYLYNCVTGCTILGKSSFIKDILPIPSKSKYVASHLSLPVLFLTDMCGYPPLLFVHTLSRRSLLPAPEPPRNLLQFLQQRNHHLENPAEEKALHYKFQADSTHVPAIPVHRYLFEVFPYSVFL